MPIVPWGGNYSLFNYNLTPQNTGGTPSTAAAGGGPAALGNFNVTPAPTTGQGPYGMVPGTTAIPPSTWEQATKAIPALANTGQLTGNIMSELAGDINPQALKNMQDAAAAYGVQSGMPGSNAMPGSLIYNKNLRNIGLDTLAVQRQGLQDYLSLLGLAGSQQTPQSLATDIAQRNAVLKSAPDPAAAAVQQQNDYWRALAATRGPAGGTGPGPSPSGGTGNYAPTGIPGPAALGFGFGSFGGGAGGPSRFSNTGAIAGYPTSGSQYYPGTDVTGLPSLDTLLGTPSTDSGGYDYYNPDTWDMSSSLGYDQTAQPSFDPSLLNMDSFYNV